MLQDVDARERVSLWPLAIAALVMGVAPNLWLHSIDASVSAVLRQFSAGTQPAAASYTLPAPGQASLDHPAAGPPAFAVASMPIVVARDAARGIGR